MNDDIADHLVMEGGTTTELRRNYEQVVSDAAGHGNRASPPVSTRGPRKNVDASNISSVARSENRTVVSNGQITVCGIYTKVCTAMTMPARRYRPLVRHASPGRGDLAAQKWIGVLQKWRQL
jgi:hypothetical protein